jgi:hypothetical protein
MRFLMMYKPTHNGPPSEEHRAAIGKLIDEAIKAGTLIATEGLEPIAKGARVRLSNGKLTVVDGPFAEAKELVGGYAIFRLKSKEEAIESAKRFLQVAGEGEVEIRQMMDMSGGAQA